MSSQWKTPICTLKCLTQHSNERGPLLVKLETPERLQRNNTDRMRQNRNKPETGMLKTNYRKKKVDKQGEKSSIQTKYFPNTLKTLFSEWFRKRLKLQTYGKQAMEVHKVEEWYEGPVKAKGSSRADLSITVREKITSVHSSITIPYDCGL